MKFDWAQTLISDIAHIPMMQVALLFMCFGALQVVIPPFPGDILLLFGGGVWPGDFWGDVLPILLPYWIGTTVMSLVMYEVGAKIGPRVFEWKWVKKIFSETTRARVTQWLQKAGAVTLFAAKFVTGMNLPMLLLSGVLGYKRSACYPVIIVTTAVHNGVMYALGTLLGDNWVLVADTISKFQMPFVIGVALVILGLVGFRLLVSRIARKKEQ